MIWEKLANPILPIHSGFFHGITCHLSPGASGVGHRSWIRTWKIFGREGSGVEKAVPFGVVAIRKRSFWCPCEVVPKCGHTVYHGIPDFMALRNGTSCGVPHIPTRPCIGLWVAIHHSTIVQSADQISGPCCHRIHLAGRAFPASKLLWKIEHPNCARFTRSLLSYITTRRLEAQKCIVARTFSEWWDLQLSIVQLRTSRPFTWGSMRPGCFIPRNSTQPSDKCWCAGNEAVQCSHSSGFSTGQQDSGSHGCLGAGHRGGEVLQQLAKWVCLKMGYTMVYPQL